LPQTDFHMARTSTGGTPRLSKSALMQQHLQAWKHSGLSQRAYLDTTGVSKTLCPAVNALGALNRRVAQRTITLRNSAVTSAYLCG